MLLLGAFTVVYIFNPLPSFAATGTGTLKVFSEQKGIKVYVDDELKGTDVIEVTGLEPGDHYVKVTKDDNVLYSELVKVTANTTSAILVKTTTAPAQQPSTTQPPAAVQEAADKFYKEGQEYKMGKLDILLSTNVQTVGSANTTYNDFPGYFSWFDYSTTNFSSTQYQTTDWKIVQGGVQQISDDQFAYLVNDKDTINRIKADQASIDSGVGWGTALALGGLALAIGGIAAGVQAATDADMTGPAVVATVGIIGTFWGLGLLMRSPYTGHWVTPGQAAKQAFTYNQDLKKKLGLPENYEPK